MVIVPVLSRSAACACLFFVLLVPAAYALSDSTATVEPAAFLNFNEGSGIVAFDLSGHGNAGSFHNVTRAAGGECGSTLLFNGIDSYVTIPYRPSNHPEEAVSVSAWFATASSMQQEILSTCYGNGGYCLGFGDGDDLWWTVNLKGEGEVAVNVRHESITPGKWHHVVGVYDGRAVRVYLDGILHNQAEASGPIIYESPNYVVLGARAGPYDMPDTICPAWFRGGLDEVRIYNSGIPYTQIMDDHFRCSQADGAESELPGTGAAPACTAASGSLELAPGSTVFRTVTLAGANETGEWHVSMQPGSKLVVTARDRYSRSAPDAWYIEIADENGRVDRTIAFPNTRNTPLDGVVESGNATVMVRYFDGAERFPASVTLEFRTLAAPPRVPEEPRMILSYPIIVIYSASWATLIALVLVILWLHRRSRMRGEQGNKKAEVPAQEEKKQD